MSAGKKGFENYLQNNKVTISDISDGGVNFRVYINFDMYGNPYVGNVHPIK
jgi:hypothetical protein